MATPVLSIVVVNWNTQDLLRRCLQTVIEQTRVSHEVWVVDNGSSDGSPEMLRREFPQVHLIANPDNRGFAAANNQALRLASGEYLLLLNSDTEVLDGALDAMVAFMHSHPAVGALGPRLLNADGSLQPSAHGFYGTARSLLENRLVASLWPWRSGRARLLTFFDHSVARPVDWVCGAALMIRRSTLQRVGLLDEAFFMYGEEVDWQWRMRAAGLSVWFSPIARILHLGGGSSRGRVTTMRQLEIDNRLRFLAKHYPPMSLRLYQAKAWLGRSCWQALGRLQGQPVTCR
ncbi:MAG: glycosyltransferase family 2 protein [Candidatus Sericytochromatia bacterium]|nr:glycosyltransferase family 2 protein [Candidatus Sericytochromatia bacterium]